MNAAAPPTHAASTDAIARPSGRFFADVEVLRDPAEALAAWRALSPAKSGSFYQSEPFVLSWLKTFGARDGIEPFFVVARGENGAPRALLPLGLFRFGPLRVAQFLGRKHSNYNLGLFAADCDASARDLRLLLRQAARRARRGPHIYRLMNMPLRWRGERNPLTLLAHRPSASNAYAARLADDGEVFLSGRLSADTRKKLRKKEKRLAAMGALRYFRARGEAEADEILDAFFTQKRQRYAGLSDEAGEAAARAFYRALTRFGADGAPPLELHALALGDRIVATFAAGLSGGRLQGLFNSFDSDPEIAKSSPGDLLLTYVLRDACARKIAVFDLGLGDARYKATFCDEVEPMADALVPVGLVGLLAWPFYTASLAAKAAIKRNPRVWRLVERRLRR